MALFSKVNFYHANSRFPLTNAGGVNPVLGLEFIIRIVKKCRQL